MNFKRPMCLVHNSCEVIWRCFFPPLSQKVLLRNLSVQDATFQYRLQPLSQCNGASEISGSQLGILDVAKY